MTKINRKDIAPFCECGCGQKVIRHTQKPRWNRFILGHHNGRRGGGNHGHHSKETCEKIRIAIINYWENPVTRKLIEEKRSAYWNDPEYKALRSGENNPNWQGGVSFEPYSQDWTKDLKEQIRQRDNYQCQICFVHQEELSYKQKLDVHHIDYDKKNCNPDNLISLCKSCHVKTSNKKNREQWVDYFNRSKFKII